MPYNMAYTLRLKIGGVRSMGKGLPGPGRAFWAGVRVQKVIF